MLPQQGQGGMGPQGPQPGQQMQQGPQQPSGRMQPGGGGGQMPQGGGANIPPWMSAMSQGSQQIYESQQELDRAEQELMRAQMMGADPITLWNLQNRFDELQKQKNSYGQSQLANKQKDFNRMTASNMAPGIGGARPNTSNPGYYAASQNHDIDMQLLAQMFGLGSTGQGPSRGGP